MAFKALDDEAVDIVENYADVSSFVAQQLRANVAAVRDDRPYRAGIGLGDDYPLRLCSPGYPMPVMPLLLYVPEAHARVRLRVRIASVERLGDTGDADALRLCLTTIAPSGAIGLPPVGDWQGAGGTEQTKTLSLTATAQTVTLTADSAAAPGWLGAVLWVWSLPRDTAIESGQIDSYDFPWVVTLDSVTTDDGVPEAGLWISRDWGSKGWAGSGTQDGTLHGVGYWDRLGISGQPADAYIVPPVGPHSGVYVAASDQWELYAMSVIEVTGMSVEVDTVGPLLPDADAFATHRPLAAPVYQPLVSGLVSMSRHRVDTLASGIVHRLNNQALGISVGDDLDVAKLSTGATWRTIQSVIVNAQPPDCGGYQALVLGSIFDNQRTPATTQLKIRLRALKLSDDAELASTTEVFEIYPVPRHETIVGEPGAWDGRMLACQMQRRNGDNWQYLGCMLGRPDDHASSLRDLSWWGVAIVPPAAEVPFYLVVDMQLSSARDLVFYGTAAIAERARDIPGGS